MATVIPFPTRGTFARPRRASTFEPEARSTLIALQYALPGVMVQFRHGSDGSERATLGSAASQAVWFTVCTSGSDLVLRDARMRFVGRYKTSDKLRRALQPLVRNLALLCEACEVDAG